MRNRIHVALPWLLVVLLGGCAGLGGSRLSGDEYFQLGRFDTAADLYRKQAERGDLSAMRKLAWLNEQGKLAAGKDYRQALSWYRQAAALGDSDAMFNVGFIYEYGQGTVARDAEAALTWYRQAARRGHVYAQYRLAALYARDRLDREDAADGYMWLLVAERNARDCSDSDRFCAIARRDAFSYGWRFEQHLSDAQLAAARRRAAAWQLN